MMLVTWGLLGLVFGPIGVWIYSMSYDQAPWQKDGMMASWQRPSFNAVIAASAMNRGFDGPLMLVISWIVTFLGLPLVVFQGPLFWLGNSMMWGIYMLLFRRIVTSLAGDARGYVHDGQRSLIRSGSQASVFARLCIDDRNGCRHDGLYVVDSNGQLRFDARR